MEITAKFDFETMPFYFLRHGETDDNLDERVMGQLDKPLNDQGIKQAHLAAQALMNLGITAIYSSSLQRALMTAEIVGDAIGAPVQAVPGLMERHYGLYQGRKRGERESGTMPKPDGVETWPAFAERTRAALRSITGPSPLLVVAHNGTYRAVIGDQKAILANATPFQLVPPESPGRGWSTLPIDGNTAS